MINKVTSAGTLLLCSIAWNPVHADSAYSTVVFPASFVNGKPATGTPVAESMKRASDAGNRFRKLLEEKKPFSGFYLSGDYTRSVDGNGYGYAYGVEWELYDQGRDEAKRELDRKKLESQLQYLQLQGQMRARRHDEKIYFIHRIEDTTTQYVNRQKMRFIAEVLSRAEEKFKKGYLTRNEIEDWRLRMANAKELDRYHAAMDRISLHPQTLGLLNRFQQADLRPAEQLLQMARQHSTELQIQELLRQRSRFFPQWKDNVSLRLFVERRREFNRTDDNVAGVRVRLPIGTNGKRKDIIGYEQRAYQEQGGAILARLDQRIRYLHSQYYFQRVRLQQQQNEMRSLESKLAMQKEYAKRSVPSLDYTPDKEILVLELRRFELYQEALMTRLKMYSVATEIESLVMPESFIGLFLSL